MTDASNPVSLKVLTWNIEGLKNHIHYLKDTLIEDSIDIAFLSEPKMFQLDLKDNMPTLENMYIYSLNSEDLAEVDLPFKKCIYY